MAITETYDVPTVAGEVLERLVNDPRLAIPDIVKVAAADVTFEGAALPFLPVPFKFSEGLAGVKGLEAAFASVIAQERYGLEYTPHAVVNTDIAGLYVQSAFTTRLNGKLALDPSIQALMRDTDINDSIKHPYRQLLTNIYRTKDGRYYHTHGSLNARPMMKVLGLDTDRIEITDTPKIQDMYAEAIAKWDAVELDKAANDGAGQAGTICYTWDEFQQLEQGKAIVNCPIYELSEATPSAPVAWPPAPEGPRKALSGIKVLELTRIIAAPAVAKGLAEHGATVLRITSSKLPDLGVLLPDLNQGKYVADLDLKSEEGKATLRELIKECDVFVDGYRPGAVARLGFGHDAVRALNPTAIYVRENCYGWHGPWQGRSGWQQIADCLVGLSAAFGQRLGHGDPGEAVVPIFPNSDFGAGASGVAGVLHALYLRATKGGVYNLDLSLSYYNILLMQLGMYPDELWDKIRPQAKIRHNWDMRMMLPAVLPELFTKHTELFTSPKFWHTLDAPAYGADAKVFTPRPVVSIDGIEVGIERGPVQNGDDPAEWPKV